MDDISSESRPDEGTPVSNVIRIDEERIRGHLDRIVRSSVEETLNALLDAEADRLVGADRLAGDGGHTIAAEMEDVDVKGLHRIEIRDDNGDMTKIALEIKFKRIVVQPPIGKQKRYPALELTVLHANERGAPKGRKPIEWKLITDLPVRNRAEAIEKINWYAMRWKIEVFHKTDAKRKNRICAPPSGSPI